LKDQSASPVRVLILSGPPGSGKTTVSRVLADRLSPSVHLESDQFYRFVRSGFVEPWRADAHMQNRVVVEAIADAAIAYALGGYHTIIDGIFSPRWFYAPLRNRLRDAAIEPAYVILRPPLATCIERARQREPSELADPSVISSLYSDFEVGPFARYRIDNQAGDPDSTSEHILASWESFTS
jgi:tRNA uridine 5-carbamoylmethylation protein Kti12